MRSYWPLTILAVLTLTSGLCMAARVVVDPNKGASRPVMAASADVDLSRPISYDSGCARLHYAVEELTARTNVSIRCGTNSLDWPVRDMPLAIAAHDIPLGRLLETIAQVLNIDLVAETIKSDTGQAETTYRLLLGARLRQALDKYIADKRQAALDRQSQYWDALVANAELPDSAVDVAKSDQARGARAIARILKEFDRSSKASILAGNTFELTTATFVRPQLLRELYLAEWRAHNYGRQADLPTNRQIDQVTFSILPEYDNVTGAATLVFSMPLHYSTSIVTPNLRLQHEARYVWERTKGHKSPVNLDEKPKDPPLPDRLPKDLLMLNIKADAKDPPAFMIRKVRLHLPRDKDVSFADVITALAREMGFTIVAEDYVDHRHKRHNMPPRINDWNVDYSFVEMEPAWNAWPPFSPVSSLPDETTVGDVLRTITNPWSTATNFRWFYNEKSRLLVGRYPDWMDAHQNLMPESLLLHLRKQSDANGIELDELVKLAAYSERQQAWWVGTSKDLSFVPPVAYGNSPSDIFWRFYDKLSPEDRAAARSEAGLPLARCEAAWMQDFAVVGAGSYASVRAQVEGAFANFPNPEEKAKREAEFKRQAALLTDPNAIRRLTLRIVSKPTKWFRSLGSEGSITPPADMDWHVYHPTIAGPYLGEAVEIKFDPLSYRFPIYSPDRLHALSQANRPSGSSVPKP